MLDILVRTSTLTLAAVMLYGTVTVGDARAQALARVEQTQTNVTSYYHFFEPGEATVQVYVLGSIGAPGIYEVSQGTDVGKLLALARSSVSNAVNTGGFGGEVRERDAIVHVYRPESNNRREIYSGSMEEVLTTQAGYTALKDGDVVTVEIKEHSRIGWRDIISVAQVAALIGLTVDRLASR